MKSINSMIEGRPPQSTEQLSTEFNKVKSIDNRQLTIDRDKAVDRALEDTSDLISQQFRPWYAKQALRLGADRYRGLAADARRGRAPQKLFSYMLRRA